MLRRGDLPENSELLEVSVVARGISSEEVAGKRFRGFASDDSDPHGSVRTA